MKKIILIIILLSVSAFAILPLAFGLNPVVWASIIGGALAIGGLASGLFEEPNFSFDPSQLGTQQFYPLGVNYLPNLYTSRYGDIHFDDLAFKSPASYVGDYDSCKDKYTSAKKHGYYGGIPRTRKVCYSDLSVPKQNAPSSCTSGFDTSISIHELWCADVFESLVPSPIDVGMGVVMGLADSNAWKIGENLSSKTGVYLTSESLNNLFNYGVSSAQTPMMSGSATVPNYSISPKSLQSGEVKINGQTYIDLGKISPATAYNLQNNGYSVVYDKQTGSAYARPNIFINPATKTVVQASTAPNGYNPLNSPPVMPPMDNPSITAQQVIGSVNMQLPFEWEKVPVTPIQQQQMEDEQLSFFNNPSTTQTFPVIEHGTGTSTGTGTGTSTGTGTGTSIDTSGIEALLSDILSALGLQGLSGEIQHNGEKLDNIKDKSGEIATNTDRTATAVEALNEKFDSSSNDIPSMPTEEFNNGFTYISNSLSSRSLNSYQVNLLDTSGSCTMDFVWNGHNFPLCSWFGRIIPYLSMFFNFSLVLINFYFFMIYKEKILEIFGKGK